MQYFTDVFTSQTWREFTRGDGLITGFSASMAKKANVVQPGDRFICYLRRKFVFVGALEATSTMYRSDAPLWNTEQFPLRVSVKPVVLLDEKHGLPLADLEGHLSFFPTGTRLGDVPERFQGSPTLLPAADGEVIWRQTVAHEDALASAAAEEHDAGEAPAGQPHAEAQALLAEIGTKLGCDVWIPKPDRERVARVAAQLRLLSALPPYLGGEANDIIRLIDVLWLQGRKLVAAFEVEHSTSIYSGLLRLADLVAEEPNLNYPLIVVADATREARWREQLRRPAFRQLKLWHRCRFISYQALDDFKRRATDAMVRNTNPNFFWEDLARPFE